MKSAFVVPHFIKLVVSVSWSRLLLVCHEVGTTVVSNGVWCVKFVMCMLSDNLWSVFFCTLFQVCIRRCDLVAECDLALFLSTIVVFFFEEEHRLFFFSTIVRHCSSRLLSDIVLLDYCSLLLRRRTSTKSTLNMHWDTSDTMSTPKIHDKLTLSCSKMFLMSNPPWY